MTDQGFEGGGYHKDFARLTENRFWRRYLLHVYEDEAKLIEQQGWKNPLNQADAQVLLCGIGSPETASTYTSFVRGINPSTEINILDLQQYPLQNSRERLREEMGENFDKVKFVQADALHMPYADRSIDAIETDFFLCGRQNRKPKKSHTHRQRQQQRRSEWNG